MIMKKRIYTLRLYFRDSPTTLDIEDVEHIQTEGGLLRLIINGSSRWYPLSIIAWVDEIGRDDVEMM